ncbi:CobW family GTP-binding protein [Cupriavidus plantarum]|uniref:CobW family GTP-binding protein n=1 Tax=Cupriavidus plantarum TaxID=942865 RepID=UPI000E251CA9|nr:GTP-binding protein [Cupriavidus plantarum]REE92419.1 G3E family GTPase [Cupriavidus plantarum]
MAERLPVTVLSGFSGAGKTALLDHVRAHADGRRVAALVDGPDLLADIGRVAREGGHDAVIVETDATAEPIAIAELFAFEDAHGHDGVAEAGYRLDTLVTVVDAATLLRDWHDADFLADRGLVESGEDDRTVVDVLVEQIEGCDVLVLNHIDEADAETLARARALVRALNPRADLVESVRGAVPAARMLDTSRFDVDTTFSNSGWQLALRGKPLPAADGIGACVYRRRRPFHPQRFADLIHTEWMREHGDVLRSKGLFWLATRMDVAGEWAQAGGVCRPGGAGAWWSALDAGDWPHDADARAEIEAEMEGPFGDRRQELVLIGRELDADALVALLDACLLNDDEMAAGPDAWAAYADPFPSWADDHDHDHDHDRGDHGHDHDHDDQCGCGHAH